MKGLTHFIMVGFYNNPIRGGILKGSQESLGSKFAYISKKSELLLQ